MTRHLYPLVIASLLAFETMSLSPTTAQALEISTVTPSVQTCDRTFELHPADMLAKKLPGRRQGAGSW